jgi:hypothetical protein
MSSEDPRSPGTKNASGPVDPEASSPRYPPASADVENLAGRQDEVIAKPVNAYSPLMPIEGQARTPLGRRDRFLLVTVATALLAAGAVGGVTLATSESHSNSGCVVVAVPSTMGGATVRTCGSAAHRFCRTQGKHDATVAAACRKQGYAADVARR